MSSPSLLEQAKTGDATAIVTLMNQAFQAKGIEVSGDRQGHCLHLWLTSATLPLQGPTVAYVRRGLERLQIQPIATLQLYGQQTDGLAESWGVEVALDSPTAEVKPLAVKPAEVGLPAGDPQTRADSDSSPGAEPTPSPTQADQPAADPIAQAYTLLELEPGATVKQVEGSYFKLKAQALRQGNRSHVEALKRAFHQLKDYLENPPPAAPGTSPRRSRPHPRQR
ncbi:MAG: hypothetical protein HC929_25200 [Leptolyngbyaceae cyanobacterium SM2_5_2]|nr:hypothetical protein [Leptolyngbyaceae cyanobacterium SM2_5_2]